VRACAVNDRPAVLIDLIAGGFTAALFAFCTVGNFLFGTGLTGDQSAHPAFRFVAGVGFVGALVVTLVGVEVFARAVKRLRG
jgi:hypothetical protein